MAAPRDNLAVKLQHCYRSFLSCAVDLWGGSFFFRHLWKPEPALLVCKKDVQKTSSRHLC